MVARSDAAAHGLARTLARGKARRGRTWSTHFFQILCFSSGETTRTRSYLLTPPAIPLVASRSEGRCLRGMVQSQRTVCHCLAALNPHHRVVAARAAKQWHTDGPLPKSFVLEP